MERNDDVRPIFTDSDRNIISVDEGPLAPVSRDPSDWPIVYESAKWGRIEEYQDHLRVNQTMWDKKTWLKECGRFPWEE